MPQIGSGAGAVYAGAMARVVFSLLGSALLLMSYGCATVRPWQREYLAKRCMDARFGEEGLAGEYSAKLTEAFTGGGLPGDAPGGGCGCTH